MFRESNTTTRSDSKNRDPIAVILCKTACGKSVTDWKYKEIRLFFSPSSLFYHFSLSSFLAHPEITSHD